MATALTQADVDKLEKAIALGVKSVTYASGTVTYNSFEEMRQAFAFAKNQLAGASHQMTPSTLAVFGRDC